MFSHRPIRFFHSSWRYNNYIDSLPIAYPIKPLTYALIFCALFGPYNALTTALPTHKSNYLKNSQHTLLFNDCAPTYFCCIDNQKTLIVNE
jgi:hypothetical protein